MFEARIRERKCIWASQTFEGIGADHDHPESLGSAFVSGCVCTVKGFGFQFGDPSLFGNVLVPVLDFRAGCMVFGPGTLGAHVLPRPSRLQCVCVKAVEDSAEWVVSKRPSKSRVPRAA